MKKVWLDDYLHLLAPGKSWNFAKESGKINFGFVFAKKNPKIELGHGHNGHKTLACNSLIFGLVRLGLDEFRVSSSFKSCYKYSVFGLNSVARATRDK